MREIGGYHELDLRSDGICPIDGVRLNSGRNALRYIVKSMGINKLYVPYFTCHTVHDALKEEGCVVEHYKLGPDFFPEVPLPSDTYIVYNNYFGCTGKLVDEMAVRYPNLIVDHCQALYAKPRGIASFYSPRKFFGLPDGGIAVLCRSGGFEIEEQDHSVERMKHLLLRIDYDAPTGYADCKKAALRGFPVRRMSKLTQALMGNLDYESARNRRLANFSYLHKVLKAPLANQIAADDVPMVYPLETEDADLRERLIAHKIYIAKYWPNCLANAELSDRIVALPLDQRYGQSDMDRILEVIYG